MPSLEEMAGAASTTKPAKQPAPPKVERPKPEPAQPHAPSLEQMASGRATPSPGSHAQSGGNRGAGSALGTIANAFDLPLAVGEAIVKDAFDTGGTGRQFAQVVKDLREGGGWHNIPGALANVADKDVYFRKGSLERVLANPAASPAGRAAAQFFLAHPKLAAGADFATEFLNPSNVVAGRAVGLAAKGLKATPIIGPALDRASEAASAAFNKYHPLKRAGGSEAAKVGRLADAAAGQARQHNVKLATEIFGNPGKSGLGGLTRDEQFEILRRATGGAPKKIAHSSGLTDAELDKRAALYRQIIDETDALQKARGMLPHEHENYFNMRGAYEVPETAREIAMGGAPKVGTHGRIMWRAPSSQEKVFDTFDEVLKAVEAGRVRLRPGFNPFNQLVSHLNRVSGNRALDDLVAHLAQTPAAAEATFGKYTGKKALEEAEKATERNARRFAAWRAAHDIANDFGLKPQDVYAATRKRPMPVVAARGRIAENEFGAKAVNEAGKAVGPTTAAPRVIQQFGRLNQKLVKRGQELADKLNDPNRVISAEFRALRDKYAKDLMREEGPRELRGAPSASVWGGAKGVRASLTPGEFIQVKNVPGLSGLDRLKYTDLKPEVVKYLTEAGAPTRDAEGLGAFLDRWNSLFRIGILTNPIIHPFYNLLWAYLGGGGDPKRLATIFRDSPLDAQAAHYGAHAHLSSIAFGGNPSRLVQSLPDAAREGIGPAADWVATRAADLNRKLVFDVLERRMATEFWASLVARGTDKAKAGELVRKAFGDYDNMTATERKISRAFFFYPWTKAVIPFWAKTLATKPQWINAPVQATYTHNELAGDPNVGKELPLTLYNGTDAEGNPQYQSLPLPQRHLEPILETVLPRSAGQVDLGAGLTARVQPLANMAQYHLTPGLGTTAAVLEQQFKEPQEPGVTPASNVVYDKDAPLPDQIAQIGKYAMENAVPFAGLIRGIVHGAGEAAGGSPGRALENLAGGYQYGDVSPAKQKELNRAFGIFRRHYGRAFSIKDPAERRVQQTRLYRQFRQAVERIVGQQKPRPAAATTNPFAAPPGQPQAQQPTGGGLTLEQMAAGGSR